MAALGRLWQHGVEIDWAAVHAGERRRRVPLPTYPFERQKFRLPVDPADRIGGQLGTAGTLATADAPVTADALVAARREPDEGYEAPAGPTEEVVARAFARLLGLDRVGRHDHFFELGGDSLTAGRLCAVLREATGAQLTVAGVFAAPTVAALARAASGKGEAG
jgi:acyl transferase domain-containing protein